MTPNTPPSSALFISQRPNIISPNPPRSSVQNTTFENNRSQLKTLLSKIGTVVTVLGFIVAVITLFPSFIGTEYGKESLQLSAWTAAKDFREMCESDKDREEPSVDCKVALNTTLPPPPKVSYFQRLAKRFTPLVHNTRDSIKHHHSNTELNTNEKYFFTCSVHVIVWITCGIVVSLSIGCLYMSFRRIRQRTKTDLEFSEQQVSEASMQSALNLYEERFGTPDQNIPLSVRQPHVELHGNETTISATMPAPIQISRRPIESQLFRSGSGSGSGSGSHSVTLLRDTYELRNYAKAKGRATQFIGQIHDETMESLLRARKRRLRD